MKVKRLLKSVVSLILVAIICLCATVNVCAVPDDSSSSSDYSKRATAMIDFFHNNNSIDAKDISVDEFRVFGVFLSNFVLPFKTDLKNIDATINKGDGIEKDFNGWNLFCAAFGKEDSKNKEPLKSLLSKYKSVMSEVESSDDDTYTLYYKKDEKYKVATLNVIFNWDNLSGEGTTLYCKQGNSYNPVFSTETEVGKTAFMLALGSSMGADCMSDANSDFSKDILRATPFGDIAVIDSDKAYGESSLTVIIPACLNPYTFSKDGGKLYLNNSFASACLISKGDITKVTQTEDKNNYYNGNYYAYCNGTDGISSFIKGGKYSSSFLMPSGVENYKGIWFTDEKDSKDSKYYLSGWTINSLRKVSDTAGGSKLAVVNVSQNLRNSIKSANKTVSVSKEYVDLYDEGNKLKSGSDNSSMFAPFVSSKPKGNSSEFVYYPFVYSNDASLSNKYDSYVVLFSNIYKNKDASSSLWWGKFGLGEAKYDKLTVFQIPIAETVSKVAVFSEDGFSSDGWSEDTELSVVKDYAFFGKTSMSKVFDYTTLKDDNGKNLQRGNAIPETVSCIDSNIMQILRTGANKYVQNSNPISTETNLWAGIYWAYLEDLVGLKIDGSEVTFDGAKPEFDWLPELKVTGFSSSIEYLAQNNGTETDSEDASEKQQSIINWTYDILNTDSVNNETRVNWLKSIVDGLFIGMHNAMVGVDIAGTITSVGNASSSGVYHSVMGYVTTPTFSEMPVTNWIMDNYVLVYIILMLIVTVLLVVMVMSKTRRLGSAVFTFVMMMLLLLLPAELLNGGILFSNKIAEDVFSGKFTYWAIVQHAQYVNNKNDVTEASTETIKSEEEIAADNLLDAAVDNATASQQLQGNGITVKWLSPKKYGLTEKIQQQAQSESDKLQLFTYFTDQLFKGEIYSADENSTFLYRTYYSLYTSAASGHKAITDKKISNSNNGVAKNSDLSAIIRSSWYGSNNSVNSRKKWTSEQKTNFVTNNISLTNDNMSKKGGAVEKKTTADGLGMMLRAITGGTHINSEGKKVTFPAGYEDKYFADDLKKPLRNEYINTNRISVILTDSTLNDAVLNFVNEGTYSKGLSLGTDVTKSASENATAYKDKGVSEGVNEFLLYTESPYYYFYNVFSDVLVDNGSTRGSSNFVRVLLDEGFFKVDDENSTSYGEFKDYLDLEGLFTYIIPYLNYANSDVKQYESTFGMTVDRSQCKNEAEYTKKCNNLQNVWNLYSPWVDALYEVNSSSQKAQSGYDTVSIDDPLNPASYYYKGRPMAFSQADAKMRGYAENDLTDVEYKLQKVLKNTYDDMIELLNYKDLATMDNGSDILISAAAMMATFNFNQEFSDTSFLSNGVTLYPLGFEMRNMNYDAFLRLIIANSTYTLSSSTMDSTGLYSNLIHNTSFITALLLILVDIVAVYIIPALKILLMVAMLALGLFMSISCALSKPDKLAKTVFTSFVIPFLCTIGVFILHTLLIALFMGNGVTGVIEYKSLSLSTGDPTITLLLLLVVDAVTALLLLKLFKKVGKDLIKYIKMTFEFAKGLTIGAAGAAVAGFVGTLKGVAHYGVGVPANHIAAKVSRHKDAKANANANQRASEKSDRKASSGKSSGKSSNGGNATPKSSVGRKGGSSNRGSSSNSDNRDNGTSKNSSKSRVSVNVRKVNEAHNKTSGTNKDSSSKRRVPYNKYMSGDKNYNRKSRSAASNSKGESKATKPVVHRKNGTKKNNDKGTK